MNHAADCVVGGMNVRLIGANSNGQVYEQTWNAAELAARCDRLTAPSITRFAMWLRSAAPGARYYMMTFVAEIL